MAQPPPERSPHIGAFERVAHACAERFGARLPRGRGYVASVYELPEPPPDPCARAGEAAYRVACGFAINRAMEHAIGLMAQQYRWDYDHCKRPRGGA